MVKSPIWRKGKSSGRGGSGRNQWDRMAIKMHLTAFQASDPYTLQILGLEKNIVYKYVLIVDAGFASVDPNCRKLNYYLS